MQVPLRYNKGFSLVELLVVIAIIGLLASFVTGSLMSARAKTRDARRIRDLNEIRTALGLYYSNHQNYMDIGSGCGWLGDGDGFFNYTSVNYPKSIARCLIEDGAIPAEIIDPTGGRSCDPDTGFAYMKYTCCCGETYIFAKLETLPQSDTATDGTCCPDCDANYGMNFYLMVD